MKKFLNIFLIILLNVFLIIKFKFNLIKDWLSKSTGIYSEEVRIYFIFFFLLSKLYIIILCDISKNL